MLSLLVSLAQSLTLYFSFLFPPYFSKLRYFYLLFESVLKIVIFFFSRKHNVTYIQLLYKVRYFVNNIMCGWNFGSKNIKK